jgi:hypothetical protein
MLALRLKCPWMIVKFMFIHENEWTFDDAGGTYLHLIDV